MKSDTFYGELMVKLIWRLSGNLIYHVFSLKNPYYLKASLPIKYL